MINFNKNWKQYLNEEEFDASLLQLQDELHPRFWINNVFNPEALEKLREIAADLTENLDIDTKIEEIIITGSIAGFNWHKLSDIDLHIILDFREIDENFDLVKDFLDAKRISWNKTHKIMIFDHEVEVYFQDINEKHLSPGTYSILEGEWLMQPTREDVELDLITAEKKAQAIGNEIDHLFDIYREKKYQESYDFSDRLRGKIKKLRSAGLEREGIYSPENLAFKMLRNSDYLSKLASIKVNAYDKKMSLDDNGGISVNILENWREMVSEMLDIEEIVKKQDCEDSKGQDGDFVLRNHADTKTLGCHPSKSSARNQEKAIKANKNEVSNQISQYFDQKTRAEVEYEDVSTEDLLNPDIPAPWERNS